MSCSDAVRPPAGWPTAFSQFLFTPSATPLPAGPVQLQRCTKHTSLRERERFYQGQGITAVPSVIIDDRHLIQGGQPPEVFEQALRRIAAEG